MSSESSETPYSSRLRSKTRVFSDEELRALENHFQANRKIKTNWRKELHNTNFFNQPEWKTSFVAVKNWLKERKKKEDEMHPEEKKKRPGKKVQRVGEKKEVEDEEETDEEDDEEEHDQMDLDLDEPNQPGPSGPPYQVPNDEEFGGNDQADDEMEPHPQEPGNKEQGKPSGKRQLLVVEKAVDFPPTSSKKIKGAQDDAGQDGGLGGKNQSLPGAAIASEARQDHQQIASRPELVGETMEVADPSRDEERPIKEVAEPEDHGVPEEQEETPEAQGASETTNGEEDETMRMPSAEQLERIKALSASDTYRCISQALLDDQFSKDHQKILDKLDGFNGEKLVMGLYGPESSVFSEAEQKQLRTQLLKFRGDDQKKRAGDEPEMQRENQSLPGAAIASEARQDHQQIASKPELVGKTMEVADPSRDEERPMKEVAEPEDHGVPEEQEETPKAQGASETTNGEEDETMRMPSAEQLERIKALSASDTYRCISQALLDDQFSKDHQKILDKLDGFNGEKLVMGLYGPESSVFSEAEQKQLRTQLLKFRGDDQKKRAGDEPEMQRENQSLPGAAIASEARQDHQQIASRPELVGETMEVADPSRDEERPMKEVAEPEDHGVPEEQEETPEAQGASETTNGEEDETMRMPSAEQLERIKALSASDTYRCISQALLDDQFSKDHQKILDKLDGFNGEKLVMGLYGPESSVFSEAEQKQLRTQLLKFRGDDQEKEASVVAEMQNGNRAKVIANPATSRQYCHLKMPEAPKGNEMARNVVEQGKDEEMTVPTPPVTTNFESSRQDSTTSHRSPSNQLTGTSQVQNPVEVESEVAVEHGRDEEMAMETALARSSLGSHTRRSAETPKRKEVDTMAVQAPSVIRQSTEVQYPVEPDYEVHNGVEVAPARNSEENRRRQSLNAAVAIKEASQKPQTLASSPEDVVEPMDVQSLNQHNFEHHVEEIPKEVGAAEPGDRGVPERALEASPQPEESPVRESEERQEEVNSDDSSSSQSSNEASSEDDEEDEDSEEDEDDEEDEKEQEDLDHPANGINYIVIEDEDEVDEEEQENAVNTIREIKTEMVENEPEGQNGVEDAEDPEDDELFENAPFKMALKVAGLSSTNTRRICGLVLEEDFPNDYDKVKNNHWFEGSQLLLAVFKKPPPPEFVFSTAGKKKLRDYLKRNYLNL